MGIRYIVLSGLLIAISVVGVAESPGPLPDGYLLPNNWRITPIGKSIPTEDLILNIQPSPDGRVMVATHGGYNSHGLDVVNAKTGEFMQRIVLKTAWFGLAWSPDATLLYASGGNSKKDRAPIYVYGYEDGRLSEQPVRTFGETVAKEAIFWAGLVCHPTKDLLFAANRTAGNIVAFKASTGEIVTRIPVDVNPYDLVLSSDAKTLYCSNWASDSVSVIDTERLEVTASIGVGDNPCDMALAKDGRLFVCCSNDNTVAVVDTAKELMVERIVTSLYERAPEGSTPNSLALDPAQKTLYVANANNNNVCVIDIREKGDSTVLGFIPSGYYPSAVALSPNGKLLFVGNAKGNATAPNIRGPHSPLPPGSEGNGTTKTLMKGTIQIVDIPARHGNLRQLTQKCLENCPYNDSLLAAAKPPKEPTVVPSKVGKSSPIKHVIYIIQENRTFDQVFGDMPKGNTDPRLTIFGRDVTPNRHAIADQFVLLDNTFCDAEVSANGHVWSNAAYAPDFVEKSWPAAYSGKSEEPETEAALPSAGFIWDRCARKGLTYRSYGEFAERVSQGKAMQSRAGGLGKHTAPDYLGWGARDYENAAEFIREFDEFEKNYDSPDPDKRLPNFIVMSLPEDHTKGSRPDAPTPRAAVASNDYGLGMIVERVSHSKYWPELALFTIQDDAQDGPDHVDARRTVSLVVSPYCKRGALDSTFYTTSSLLRTIELLLGLQPMSQYDAAANPMYAAFTDTPDLTPYTLIKPLIDINEMNKATAWGAKESDAMDFSDIDRTPMFALNEIVWKSVKGADSAMPAPVHRFQSATLVEK